ncbi:MAG: helix-turn-helix domain-containing protein [Bacteriovoracaceae bacterium]
MSERDFMTLDQIEMIEAIINEGSYQAAAKKLSKSQPSLSNGVKKLKSFMGFRFSQGTLIDLLLLM